MDSPLGVPRGRLTHLARSLDEGEGDGTGVEAARHLDVPLRVHARYTRDEILAAFGIGDGAKVDAWQTGVRWAPDAMADLLVFTLGKSGGGFSPTTRYQDYAISPSLVHWQSQSVTRADSEAGRRYREHVRRGTSITLFARLDQDERASWFVGPATYVSHEGERPMSARADDVRHADARSRDRHRCGDTEEHEDPPDEQREPRGDVKQKVEMEGERAVVARRRVWLEARRPGPDLAALVAAVGDHEKAEADQDLQQPHHAPAPRVARYEPTEPTMN